MKESYYETELEQELTFSTDEGFWGTNKLVHYGIILFFASVLFAYLHFREVQVDIPELNHIASNYIVSQVDFNFPDDEATIVLKLNALREIGKIYELSKGDINQRYKQFNALLLYNQIGQDRRDERLFREFEQAVQSLQNGLFNLRLTDPHTLEKMKELGFSTKDTLVYVPSSLFEPSVFPLSIWDEIKRKYLPSNRYDAWVTSLILDFFETNSWYLEEDTSTEQLLQKRIQEEVPETITHVQAGSRLIDQGDKVTAKHIAMLLSMKAALGESRHLSSPMTLLGTLILTLLLLGIFIAYFRVNFPSFLNSNRKLLLLVVILVMTMALSKLTEFFILNASSSMSEIFHYPLLVPLAAILICCLFTPRIATFVSGFLAVVSSFALAFEWEGFLLINLMASVAAILTIHSLRRRKEIFIVCAKAWGCSALAVIAFHLYTNRLDSWSFLSDIASSCFFMLFTAVLVVGILPLLETGFKVMTDVSLMEYMDPNNDLLRRLTIEAPGTYQHSVVVGNLAEAAAVAIGANGLFCRVATLYHDIGKIITSQYFTENQLGEVNIHQLLNPEESAHMIMSHVSEGVILAKEADLPEPIIDIIKEHHGTTLVYYFYCKQLEKMGGDKSKVDEREFRYSGPKPRTKESGIIMLADSFEAASRSLDKIHEEALVGLVERIVREKVEDNQFERCLLTFQELSIIKKVLVKTLLAAGHARVKYPTRDKKNEGRVEEIA